MAIQRKHPFIEKVIRFFYWPKTAIVGNEFIYETHNNVLNTESYEAQKVPSSSYLIVKFLAAFLYPFFNPVAAIVSFFRGVANPEIEKKITAEKQRGTEIKKIIKDAHEKNMQNLTGEQALSQFDENEKTFWSSWNNLIKKINNESDWATHAQEASELFELASSNFSLLLVAMSKIIEDEKQQIKTIDDRTQYDRVTCPIASPEGMASRIVAQSQNMREPFDGKKSFARRFTYSGLIHMYHYCREGVYFVAGKNDEISVNHPVENNENGYTKFVDKKIHAKAEAFYLRGTSEYSFRQTYNTNMKLFYNLFGGEKFRSILSSADERFDKWTRIDTSKDEVTFKPMPGTRPT